MLELYNRDVNRTLELGIDIRPIVRDPSGKAFFDANGQAWDVKSFNSNFKPKKGGYTLECSFGTDIYGWELYAG